MIGLTTRLGNIVYVNPDHIEFMKVCSFMSTDDLETPTQSVKNEHKHDLCVWIRTVSGQDLVVTECLIDIYEKIRASIGE